ncbi:MAG: NAD-glutamate dehydrogenase [Thiohalocapsa sp.]
MTPTLQDILDRLEPHFPDETPEMARELTAALLRHTPLDELDRRDPEDICEAGLSLWGLFTERGPGTAKLRIYSPELRHKDWRYAHSVVELVTDDMPFLVDSIRMALNCHGLTVHLIAHSVVRVARDEQGRVVALGGDGPDRLAESIMYIEISRRAEKTALAALKNDITGVLADVRAAVDDWSPMRAKVHEILAELAAHPPPVEPAELDENKAFLEWIEANNFTFLGYRYYELAEQDGQDVLTMVPGSALGTAPRATTPTPSQTFSSLPPQERAAFRSPDPLILTKANVRASVHRPVYMDYIGVKRFDEMGRVIGEHRFLGLYTSAAYHLNTREIPVVRRKVAAVFERTGLSPVGHNGKALANILETYPRDELLQIDTDELYENAIGMLHLQERQLVRLFVRRERFGRFVSCIVFVPRERYDTASRECIQALLMRSFSGESTDFTVHLSESVLARAYFIIHTPPGQGLDYDHATLEADIAACVRTWHDELQARLIEGLGEEAGGVLFRRYRDAFPPAYRDDFEPRAAARDIEDIEELPESGWQVLALYQPIGSEPGQFRFKLFSSGQAVALSDILPLLENTGVRVLRERPYQIRPIGHPALWIYDFLLAYDEAEPFDLDAIRERFQGVVSEVWRGRAENDGFNRLVLSARLDCREIIVLRAYARFLRQTGIAFSQSYMEQALAGNPEVARLLIKLFQARFDIEQQAHSATRASRAIAELQEGLDAVASLDEDRILRSFLAAIQATLRTNFYQRDPDGEPKPYLSFKLEPRMLPELPRPRPMYEIFVYSPRVEGVHLRGGKIARGGLRWSDRREDFRTEILGLMKAQMVKNAIIVPVGAKGGFVVKRPPVSGDREALRNEAIACYRTFIRGLLDLTDNLRGEATVPPPSTLRYDGDDPYLVVAADKGTASFSDIANALSQEYGFWLGDAFASGGSAGYDHKAMGITARGAWVAVQRHFRELGIDVQREAISVLGIGDMSGDVFGNGMLRSRTLRLVAAFDHRHIFIDPHPEAEASYRERQRLFALERSSWDDYDRALISTGGGVYPRSAKSIRLSPQAREALGLNAESMPPDQLIRGLLKAPVDLIWNGGIGTYVKAGHESHTEVGDRANEALRVNAADLRCRVIGEGGNLGVTQAGRIEYALAGGRINTDFIDNAGGVACSDYEVNIKILLNDAVGSGDLDSDGRNALLAEMTDEVAGLVLAESYWQTGTISLMESRALRDLDEHLRFMQGLERTSRLDRGLEGLPSDETLAERRAAGSGLSRPELAVLVAYAKNTIYQGLLASDAPDDPYLARELLRYFPEPLRELYRERIQRHPLRRELISTFVTNRMINRLGASVVFALEQEHDADIGAIVRAYLAAWAALDLSALTREITALDYRIPAPAQLEMLGAVTDLVRHAMAWLLRHGPTGLDVRTMVERYRPGAVRLAETLPDLLAADRVQALRDRARQWTEARDLQGIIEQALLLEWRYRAFDLIEITTTTQAPIEMATGVYFGLDRELELDWLQACIDELPAEDHWQLRARDALHDEVYTHQRQLCERILEDRGETSDATDLLEAWARRRRSAIERYRSMTSELAGSGMRDLAMLSVVVRGLEGMAGSPG